MKNDAATKNDKDNANAEKLDGCECEEEWGARVDCNNIGNIVALLLLFVLHLFAIWHKFKNMMPPAGDTYNPILASVSRNELLYMPATVIGEILAVMLIFHAIFLTVYLLLLQGLAQPDELCPVQPLLSMLPKRFNMLQFLPLYGRLFWALLPSFAAAAVTTVLVAGYLYLVRRKKSAGQAIRDADIAVVFGTYTTVTFMLYARAAFLATVTHKEGFTVLAKKTINTAQALYKAFG